MDSEVALRLAETVAWCSWRVRAEEAGTTTRTLALRPPIMSREGLDVLLHLLSSPAEPAAAVDFVCQARRQELDRLGIDVKPVEPDLAGGRILYTTIDTDSCAVATPESNGYYDLDDLPGWDTWFHHRDTGRHSGSIYCWAPPQLVDLAHNGMEVMPFEVVRWIESLNELSS